MPAPVEHQEKTASRFRFGLFEADAASGELRKSGIRIRLQAQPFRVLICLLERPGEVVTRDEIQQRLWGNDTIVDFDHSLGTAINKLREALGDSAENPRFIETLARRGYRFIAPVTVTEVRHEEKLSLAGEHRANRPAETPAPAGYGTATRLVVPGERNPALRRIPGRLPSSWSPPALSPASRMRSARNAPPLISQITFSGRVSPGDPLFESFPGHGDGWFANLSSAN